MELFAATVDRGLVTIAGDDAGSFLQSLLSQDLDPLAEGDGAHTLLLQPQGKLLVDLRALRIDARTWWCDCEAPFTAALADGLARFRIRVRAEVDVVDDVALLAVRGPEAPARAGARLGVVVPDAQHGHVPWDGGRVVRADWPDRPGVDVLGPRAVVEDAARALDLPRADAGAFERARIEAGVPRQGLDLDERTIPQEAFLDRSAVSFTKGCFVGQELVCRIDTRGRVTRLLRRLRLERPVPRGATVEAGGRAVGDVTSVAGDVALAMLRRDVEPPAEVTVVGEGTRTAARVEAI